MQERSEVYLDHLIERENLRYKRRQDTILDTSENKPETLQLVSLTPTASYQRTRHLRKPDFQRATWAWTPEDCVSLLDSIIKRQVVPSIIMWTSPDSGLDYILDGGHRVSVVIAWLNNDWGREYAKNFDDSDMRNMIRMAADEVERLVNIEIGNITEYIDAEKRLQTVIDQGLSPMQNLDDRTFRRGRFYQDLLKGFISFNILWVSGNYEIAEQSFLKINKSGKQLSEWETTLIENRNSAFARATMSIASQSSARYYWPTEAPDTPNKILLEQEIETINTGVNTLQSILFQPPYQRPMNRLEQPFLVADLEKRPYYTAELLTITEGYRGQTPETEKLLARGKNANPEQLINEGHRLITHALEIFEHLIGLSNNAPKSMEIVPALYFYTDEGRHVRSLLYGLLYWLFNGRDEREILDRKIIFSAYRGAFEFMFEADKAEVIQRIGRRIGSGPEVTTQTAKYFQGLLELLVKHRGDFKATAFLDDYSKFLATLAGKPNKPVSVIETTSRIFTPSQKSAAVREALLKSTVRCEICEGLLNPAGNIQHDHIIQWAEGGSTSRDNQRIVHPFCNNKRKEIENYKAGKIKITLPIFKSIDDPDMPQQLSFFDDPNFNW
jgi:hypothetical protein